MSKIQKSDGKPKRPQRVPMGQGLKMQFPQYQDPNFKLYLFSSKPGKLAEAEAGWWEYVKDENGEKVTVPSGQYPLYLMRLPIDTYNEAQEAKQARIVETMNNKGKIGKGEYSPHGTGSAIQEDGDFDPLA